MSSPIPGEWVRASRGRGESLAPCADTAPPAAARRTTRKEHSREASPPRVRTRPPAEDEHGQAAAVPEVRQVLLASEAHVRQGVLAIQEIRAALSTTASKIEQSRQRVAESDQAIARWQRLGNEPEPAA